MTRRTYFTLLAGLAVAILPGNPATAEELRVMTYNVRMPAESDGPDYWEHRKDIAVEVVRRYRPDIFGTQELFHRQGEYFEAKLDGYTWFGRSRRGNREDEYMGVFYRTDRLELIEEGDFWLSETPDIPGSQSWDMSLPRMVTWGLFRTKPGGTRFYFLNTHFPHRAQDAEARKRCAGVILDFLDRLPRDVPVLLAGDFNDPAGGAVHEMLTAPLEDAWLSAETKTGPEGTFHGFRGVPGERRIDWILYRAPWSVKQAEAITYNQAGRYPSDHLPVLAVFETGRE